MLVPVKCNDINLCMQFINNLMMQGPTNLDRFFYFYFLFSDFLPGRGPSHNRQP